MNFSKLKQMKDVLKSKEAPKSQDQERQEPGRLGERRTSEAGACALSFRLK